MAIEGWQLLNYYYYHQWFILDTKVHTTLKQNN